MDINKTPCPWSYKNMKVMGVEDTRIMDRGGCYIAHQDNIRNENERGIIAAGIVSAINNTYGAGINPEAVPDMLKALNDILPYLEAKGTNGNHWVNQIKESINKSKL